MIRLASSSLKCVACNQELLFAFSPSVLKCMGPRAPNLIVPVRGLRLSHKKFFRLAAKPRDGKATVLQPSKLYASSLPKRGHQAAAVQVPPIDAEDEKSKDHSRKRDVLKRPTVRRKHTTPIRASSLWNYEKFLPFKRAQPPPASITTASILTEMIPKPLKLMNSADPTVLSALYKSQESYLSLYMGLSKFRLTTFVVLTAVAGYSMSTSALVHPDLLWISLGTFLTSASANTFNQIVEVEYDGLMDRTKNRVLVQKLLTREHALCFAILAGIGGTGALYAVNELSAAIGLLNLVLYAGVYTPLKRKHIINTWVGSVVGALPPLIGSAGACGSITVNAAVVMAAIMYCWQFPHFNALSWNLRGDYDRAGYKMMCFVNPRLCRSTTLRYSVALTAICAASPYLGVTDTTFLLDSGILNAYLIYLSWKFYKNPDAKTSRNLFRYTLVHLPLLILFLIIGNKSLKEPVKTVATPIIQPPGLL